MEEVKKKVKLIIADKQHNSFKDRTGEIHKTNQGYTVKIIKYYGNHNITIQFENGFIIDNLDYSNLKKGGVAYPYHPSVNGIGYLGDGNYKSRINKKYTLNYLKWQDMIFRCYSDKCNSESYKDVTVCEKWHNFQVFAQWFEDNWKPHMEGWALEKDVLIKGNKVYSPENCCFVPSEINNLFITNKNKRGDYPIGVRKKVNGFTARIYKDNEIHLGYYKTPEEAFQAYKVAKESYIKEVAEKWKDKIDPRVYQAMYNYNVEITD